MSSLDLIWKPSLMSGMSDCLRVQELIRPLFCSSPAVLVRCSDGFYYIIQQPGSCPSDDALAASLLGPAIATSIGLPVVYSSPVLVDDRFVDSLKCRAGLVPSRLDLTHPGLYLARRLAGDISGESWAVPYVSPRRWTSIVNRTDFVGMQFLRILSGCHNEPAAMYKRSIGTRELKAVFVGVDQFFASLTSKLVVVPFNPRAMTNGLYSGLGTGEEMRAWVRKLQQQTPPILDAMFSALTWEWPQLDASRLHADLMSRIALLAEEVRLSFS